MVKGSFLPLVIAIYIVIAVMAVIDYSMEGPIMEHCQKEYLNDTEFGNQ
jgi:hypothetical protein